MCEFMPMEQIEVLLEDFNPKIPEFKYRKSHLIEKIYSGGEEDVGLVFKKLINLHRAMYAICYAREDFGNEIIFSYKQICALAKSLEISPSDSDLLRCPLKEIKCLIDEAVLISASNQREAYLLRANSMADIAEFEDYIRALDEQERPVPLLL